MKESIDQLLDQIENYKKEFYPKAIELHKDERLRQLDICKSATENHGGIK